MDSYELACALLRDPLLTMLEAEREVAARRSLRDESARRRTLTESGEDGDAEPPRVAF